MGSIDRLGRDLTVVLIAHRLSTLRNCDMIYRLDRGELVGRGRYEEMVGGAGAADTGGAAAA